MNQSPKTIPNPNISVQPIPGSENQANLALEQTNSQNEQPVQVPVELTPLEPVPLEPILVDNNPVSVPDQPVVETQVAPIAAQVEVDPSIQSSLAPTPEEIAQVDRTVDQVPATAADLATFSNTLYHYSDNSG